MTPIDISQTIAAAKELCPPKSYESWEVYLIRLKVAGLLTSDERDYLRETFAHQMGDKVLQPVAL